MGAPPTPTGSYSGSYSGSFIGRIGPVRNHRAASPPLEKDEKEFTQTARGMQKRKLGRDIQMSGVPSEMEDHPARHLDSDSLFGDGRGLSVLNSSVFTSSPAMKASSWSLNPLKRGIEESNDLWARIDGALEWDLRSPENIELDELDGLLDDF